ncbi:squalene/phytoene synthase family protein [Candidatus Micrarchaeota archaeon]|nr:squalene/phytoene synthase family protein [Candidatus Micrarchaeota archaeon]
MVPKKIITTKAKRHIFAQHFDGSALKKAYSYCHDVTKRCDTNFYLGFQFLPADKRNAVYASYAFCRYADDIVDENNGMGVPALLAKWESDLHNAYKNKAAHPIMVALADAVHRYNIPKAPYLGLIKGCKMDLMISRYKNFGELLRYCELVATTISSISLHIFGCSNPNAKKYGRYLSIALQLTNIMRDVGEDAKKGRIYIPLEELERFGYTESELLRGVMNSSYYKLMKFQARRARSYYKKAFFGMKNFTDDSRFATIVMGGVYHEVLQKIERRNFNVYGEKVHLGALEKQLLLLKLAAYPKI